MPRRIMGPTVEYMRTLQLRLRLRLRLRPRDAQPHQPIDCLLRLHLDPSQQLLARRYVLDEPQHDPRGPDAALGVPRLVHQPATLAGNELPDVLELGAPGTALERDDLLRDAVLEHARRVVQRAEDVYCVLLCGRDDLVFDVLVDRAKGECVCARGEGKGRKEG